MPLRVTALYTYPVKSCARLVHDTIALEARGPVYDRRWMVVSAAPGEEGRFLTQRELPNLALAQPALSADALCLTAPGLPEIRVPLERDNGATKRVVVWRDTCDAVDEGDEAAGWFSELIGYPARLVRMADGYVRRVDPRYSPEFAQVGFADAYPLLIIQQASLDDLNQRLAARGKAPVPMSRFRPSIVIDGGAPFAEDNWRRIEIAGLPLDIVKPCARCVTTTVDQAAGRIPDHEEPLATLATFRKSERGVLFGQNAVHRALGCLRVGDGVRVLKTSD